MIPERPPSQVCTLVLLLSELLYVKTVCLSSVNVILQQVVLFVYEVLGICHSVVQ